MKSLNLNTALKRLAVLTWFFLSACAADPEPGVNEPLEPTGTAAGWTQCPEQRPQMCPQYYDPVCGYATSPESTGPGPDSQSKTYSNGCSACADTGVAGYKPGACPAN